MDEIQRRIRCPELRERIISAEAAAALIQDGMIVGTSGFTPSGYPKAIALALAERVKQSGERLKITVFTGASVGDEIDGALTETGIISRRSPYQTNNTLRKALNTPGGVDYFDEHLILCPQKLRYGFYGKMNVALVEACAITEEGGIVPTTSVGNTATFIECADLVLVELNTVQPASLEGFHDIYLLDDPPRRQPIPLTETGQRIGTTYIPCPLEKIAGIVITDIPDSVRPLSEPNAGEVRMAQNIVDFLQAEVKAGRLPDPLPPLQSGVGNVANAVLKGLKNSSFENLSFFSEVIQDAAFELIDCGKFTTVSGTSLTPSAEGLKKFYENVDFYKQHILLRPTEISNHPELARRLGVIAMNTAIEADIYGQVNSTHIMGTRMMNGVGGSGDFARSAYLSIFMTSSVAKDGDISCIVPMCSHVDHTEHDVCVIVTEQGLADLRNKSPRERALAIINNCSHPDYRPLLLDYYQRALKENKPGACHTPLILSEALSWHDRFNKTGSMKRPQK